MNKIIGLSGLCGSGKSTLNIANIITSQNTHFVYVVPSILLTAEIAEKLNPHNIIVQAINSDSTPEKGQVISTVYEYIKEHSDSTLKHVLVITHQLYEMMDNTKLDSYLVYFDELPPYMEEFKIMFDNDVTESNLFIIDPITSKVSLTEYAMNEKNHFGKNIGLISFINCLRNDRFTAYFVTRKQGTDKEFPTTTFIKFPTVNYFNSNTIISSADLEDSMLHKILSKEMKFEIQSISSKNNNHESNNITIYYGTDLNNTKYLRDNNTVAYQQLVAELASTIAPNNQDSLLLTNTSFKHGLGSHFKKVSHNAHGLNQYSHINNILIQSSLNFSKETATLVKKVYDVSDQDLYVDRSLMTYYQIIMRSSLRVNGINTLWNIAVIDHKSAIGLKDRYFPNAKLVKIPTNIKFKTLKINHETISPADSAKACKIRKAAITNEFNYTSFDLRFAKMPTKEMIKTSFWNKVNSSGKYI